MATNEDNANKTLERLVEQETLIADATELLCELLIDQGLERRELAERLGRSKGYVSQVLSGDKNMTLRTLADIAFALGYRFELRMDQLDRPRMYPHFNSQSAPPIQATKSRTAAGGLCSRRVKQTRPSEMRRLSHEHAREKDVHRFELAA